MKTCRYDLRFTTPAFLGNASQQAQWRTPPIKALLRQWWRVAAAHELNYNVDRLREQENRLFGTAADSEGSSQKSRIRIRLSQWNEGKLKEWTPIGTVVHPEVKNRDGGSTPVGSDLYLGFGPLLYDRSKRGTALKTPPAIQAGDSASLSLAFPTEHATAMETALWLLDRYGTLGGRSRNGWGSASLRAAQETPVLAGELDSHLARSWQDALALDWPHAVGTDKRGALIWATRPVDDWKALMRTMAQLKIGLRTQFRFTTGRNAPAPEDRHWLSYPVTNHSVQPWGGNARLPNSLRFKVRPTAENPGQLVGVIFHVPCLPPPSFRPDLRAIESVWQRVHAFLDDPAQQLTRIPA